MSIYDVFGGGNRPFDKEEWAAAKQAQRKEAYELIDNTCSEMMASGDSFRQYLDVQGRFDRYSVANAILVSAQMPEATQLKEYSKWKANRVYVNKDAQKIIILEPSKEYTREDGTKGISYNAKVVYDISETSAKDRQQEQEPKSMRELVSALIDASPVPCVPVGELELPAYYDSSQQTIFVKKGLSEEVLFVSMAKEVSAASMLLLALVFYLKYEAPPDEQNFPMVMELLRAGEVREDDDSYVSPLDELFDRLEMVNSEHIALKYYRDYHSGSAKTLKSIQITLAARLEKFNLESLAGLTATDELDLPSLGEKKVALFALIPDNDTSFNFLVSILYTQLFQQLFYLADHKYGGSLPVHCHFIMDEFANVSLPDDFDKILSVMRSRGVSVSIILQNLAQLKALFEKQWESIVGNCVRPEVASAL